LISKNDNFYLVPVLLEWWFDLPRWLKVALALAILAIPVFELLVDGVIMLGWFAGGFYFLLLAVLPPLGSGRGSKVTRSESE